MDAARIFTLAHGIDEVNTERRLRAAAPLLRVPAREVDAWIAAYYHIQGLRLRRQADCLRLRLPADNRIDPYALHDFDRRVLVTALEQARTHPGADCARSPGLRGRGAAIPPTVSSRVRIAVR